MSCFCSLFLFKEDKPKALAAAQQKTGKASPPAQAIEEAVEEVKLTKVNGKAAADPPEVARMRKRGIIPPDVVVDVQVADPAAADPPPEPEAPPAELTDEEYLASLPLRAKLENESLRRFDRAALAFRRLTPARRRFHAEIRPFIKVPVIDDYTVRMRMVLSIESPDRWYRCPALEHGGCGGAGIVGVIGQCPNCKGRGFMIPF